MSDATTISTHVLDTALGTPAAGIPVSLVRIEAGEGASVAIATAVTNADGRVPSLGSSGVLGEGHYRLCFDVADYFASTGRATFYGQICIDFIVAATPQHYHVPLLLSPFGYSTYRGS
ncbi:hydroxyisourate hydrolase [soil metagenome]